MWITRKKFWPKNFRAGVVDGCYLLKLNVLCECDRRPQRSGNYFVTVLVAPAARIKISKKLFTFSWASLSV